MSLIFLIGMPAVGKSYWASCIAAHHGYTYVDTDTMLELQQGLSIPEIFAINGEAGFRMLEHELLKHIIEHNATDTIVACGGGTPCYLNNVQLMKEAGCVIYLEASTSLLMEHLSADGKFRPLLTANDTVLNTLSGLYHDRKTIYEQAHYILPAENVSLTTFDKIISTCISGH